jgi:general nucleoside transport system permease protein
MMDWTILLSVLDSTIRLTTPILLCCLGGLYSERSGVFDIGIEGKMLFAAFAAGVAASATGSAYLGLLAAIGAGVTFSALHGFACITQRGNQIISGVAINFLAAGMTALLGKAWYQQGGKTPQLENATRFQPIHLPDTATVKDIPVFGWILGPINDGLQSLHNLITKIPVLGVIYDEVLTGHNLLVYAAFLAVPLTWWVIYRTRFGLRLRAVGENPAAVDTAGISVTQLRYSGVLICGVFAGIAGAYLAIAQSANFSPNMSAGRGFIALAALIFAKWNPVGALGACLLFGFLEAFAIPLQGASIPGLGWKVPVQLITASPYILTVILLAGFIGKAIPPKAGGVAYVKER